MNETPKLCPVPPDKLLASMAMRYDHGFGLLAKDDHARASILTTMRQLWEEVAGVGFYQGPGTLAEANSKLAESEAKVKDLEAKLAEAVKPCEWVHDPRGGYTVYCVSGSWSPVLLPFCPGCGHPAVKNEEARKKGAEHGE